MENQMSSTPIDIAEAVSAKFSEEELTRVRNQTRAVVASIAARVKPGMVEEDAVEMAREVMREAGMQKGWHPTRVRFGRNTIVPMKRPSEPGVILQENDIFFVDIGPLAGDWEGDGGDTFVVGHQPEYERCARDARLIFHEARKLWLSEKVTGKELYAFAEQRARDLGWELNFDLPGHRLSDFPHTALHTGALADARFPPSAARWMLEIHIRNAERTFGAFFEDLLLDDGHYPDPAR
jgi:Xaa-Pro aminopeptidase